MRRVIGLAWLVAAGCGGMMVSGDGGMPPGGGMLEGEYTGQGMLTHPTAPMSGRWRLQIFRAAAGLPLVAQVNEDGSMYSLCFIPISATAPGEAALDPGRPADGSVCDGFQMALNDCRTSSATVTVSTDGAATLSVSMACPAGAATIQWSGRRL